MNRSALPVDLSVMQDTLREYRKSLGKETQSYHYMNEVRLVKFAVTGSCQGCYRNLNTTRKLSQTIRRVVCLNMRLIKQHVQYKDRKKSCRDLFLRATSVALQN